MGRDRVKYLSVEIGERRAGRMGEKKGAEYIVNEMKALGLEVNIQEFKFLGWKSTRDARVMLLKPELEELETVPFLFSETTPDGGVIGNVKYVGIMDVIKGLFEWPKYAVIDDYGNDLAYIVARPDGPAIPFPLKTGRYYGCAPYAMIGQKDYKRFKEWFKENKVIKVQMDVGGEFLPGLTSQNVIGTLKGKKPDEYLVVCAHYDSALNSPGANDNASGVDAMLTLAEKLLEGKKMKKTIKFIAFGAEEYMFLGSRYFVDQIKEQGELFKIKVVVSFDMVGAGDVLRLRIGPKVFRKLVKNVIELSNFKKDFRVEFHIPRASSDHWPFYELKIPVIGLNLWPYPYYHQNTDTYEKTSEDTIEKITEGTLVIIKESARAMT